MFGTHLLLKRTGAKTVSGVLLLGLLAGCQGAPTYGTGVRSDKQLMEDLTGIVSLAPKRGPKIDYEPRPELVKPADVNQLPAPQETITTAAADSGQWPESPEQRRQRIRNYATENRDNPDFKPIVRSGREVDPNEPMVTSPAAADRGTHQQAAPRDIASNRSQQADYRARKQLSEQGFADRRTYLSEPPLDYRQPSATAPADDLGEDEAKKEAVEHFQKKAVGGVAEEYVRELKFKKWK